MGHRLGRCRLVRDVVFGKAPESTAQSSETLPMEMSISVAPPTETSIAVATDTQIEAHGQRL